MDFYRQKRPEALPCPLEKHRVSLFASGGRRCYAKEGYEVYVVADAVGGTSVAAHEAALRRIEQAGKPRDTSMSRLATHTFSQAVSFLRTAERM
jgi:hypothetical protein